MAVRPVQELITTARAREGLGGRFNAVVDRVHDYHGAMHRPSPADEARADAELLDVLDAKGHANGERKPRAAVHRDGDWHRTVHVWVVRSDGHVLIQRRAEGKELEPGKLDVSVGGHLVAGELDIDVVREVEEELGLAVTFGSLTYLGTAVTDRSYDEYVDREFQDVYAVVDDTPLSQLSLRASEVDVVYEVPLARAIELFRDGRYVAAGGYDSQRRVNNALLVAEDLPSQGAGLLAAELDRVKAWLDGEDLDALAQSPIDSA
jgi:isopentenyldiphosphate isomerase